jgi:hypothetical protein
MFSKEKITDFFNESFQFFFKKLLDLVVELNPHVWPIGQSDDKTD